MGNQNRLDAFGKDVGIDRPRAFHRRLAGKSEERGITTSAFSRAHLHARRLGLNVIEANAMGTPAAVYPVSGPVDSTVPGQTGLVTEAETPESLASALADIVKTPAGLFALSPQRLGTIQDFFLAGHSSRNDRVARKPRRNANTRRTSCRYGCCRRKNRPDPAMAPR